MPPERVRYGRLASMENHGSACDDGPCEAGSTGRMRPIWTRTQAMVAFSVNLVMFVTSICILLVAIGRRPLLSQLECAKKLSPYSPVWDAVEFWEGTFINYFNASSIYRGPPTLEREQAWHELWHYHLVPVDEAGVEALNQTQQGRHVEVFGSSPANPEYGAMLEVFHQLHCLNLLRQQSWGLKAFDRSWGELYPSFMQDRIITRIHIDHCIETLRLSLMCSADITPVLFVYNENGVRGFEADFNIPNKCRDFNKIVDYVKENGVELHLQENEHG